MLANMAMVARAGLMGLNIQADSVVILCAPQFNSSIENQTVSLSCPLFQAAPSDGSQRQ